MKEFDEISMALTSIRAEFANDFARMDFLFTYRKGSHRSVVNVIRSLPDIYLKVLDNTAPDIGFESTWVNKPAKVANENTPVGGWQAVATEMGNRRSTRNNFMSHAAIVVRKVREIAIFDYGFEIRAADNFEIVAVKLHTWKNPEVEELQSIVGRTFRGLQLNEEVDTELKSWWRHPILIERAKKIAEKNGQFVNVGQYSRELLVDADDDI